ncbi:hypothetical protein QBC35DRAFT_298485 [Podospora australis]|uniref:2EXR domain-containing protein n=1 Tax=Podospora australis TaxID=1536484 RepID=A0AAN6WPL8_9PEZI|nr:hypothetical protein QBC35DRAFT_298485 [Podospora australis]
MASESSDSTDGPLGFPISRGGTANYKDLPLFTESNFPKVPAFRFSLFPLLPTEIQLQIWREALRDVTDQRPRLIPLRSLLPPLQETHAVVRILSQTCGGSREVAIRCLKECRKHEKHHNRIIPAIEEPAPPAPVGPVQPAGNNIFGNGNPGQGGQALPAGVPPPIAAARFGDINHVELNRFTNPLYNHIHNDTDYILFTKDNFGWLSTNPTDAVGILRRKVNIAAPVSTWHTFFRSEAVQVPLQHSWPITRAPSALFLLPIDKRIFTAAGSGSKATEAVSDENARWVQATDIPWDLLRVWSDDEMRLFHESYSWRPRFADRTMTSHQLPPPNSEAEEAKKLARHNSDNPFDQWTDANLIFETWHCFHVMFPDALTAADSDPPRFKVRFAHVKHIEMYDFLDERPTVKPSRTSLDWTRFIPRWSAEEMRRYLTTRKLAYPDRSKSELYPHPDDMP